MIDKRFEKLLLSIHTCVDREGRVDKTAMTHSDVFDACRMALEAYTFSQLWFQVMDDDKLCWYMMMTPVVVAFSDLVGCQRRVAFEKIDPPD